MTNYLLDPALIVNFLGGDSSEKREQLVSTAAKRGDALWIYVGAIDTIVSGVANEFCGGDEGKASSRLKLFGDRVNWLAALAEDAELIDLPNSAEARSARACGRLGSDAKKLCLNPDGATGESLDGYLDKHDPDPSIPFIDLAYQQRLIRPKLEAGLFRVLTHGRYIAGPEIEQLERSLAEYVGVRHAVAVSNGTDALLIALLAAGVGAGDEVITSPFTFAATGEMIHLLGARPVYVDIDPVTYNMDARKIEAAITGKTRAIMPVSIFGQCADMDAINQIAAGRKLPVIEDGAQSFGARYHGGVSCGLSDIGCTSFFPSKPLGGYGDSGACFTDDNTIADAVRQIRDHGQTGRYKHTRLGLNGRMSSFQASVLIAKLDIFEQEVELRQQVGVRYTEMFSKRLEGRGLDVVPPAVLDGNNSVYAQYTLLVPNRERVQAGLNERGVPSAVHYPVPLNKQPAMLDDDCSVPVCEDVSKRVLSVPMHPYLSESQQSGVVDALIESVARA